MLKYLDLFPGYKTGIIVVLAALLWAVGQMDLISPDDVDNGLTILGILGGGTLAMKVNRLRPGANLLLLGILSGSMLISGCAAVHYDGATARSIAEQQLSRVVELGAPVDSRDCDPLKQFSDAMQNEDGDEWITRWLWENDDSTEPKLIARSADRQFAGCSILAARNVSGTNADRLRSVLRDFWTRVGLKVGDAQPNGGS